MARKLGFIVLTFALTIAALGTAPQQALASCSGDDCGCYDDLPQCQEDCRAGYPQGSQALFYCIGNCTREATACAVACCA